MKATLNYGHQIPLNGFGTFSLTGDEGQATLRSALEAGYRLMDTASIYGNERDLGAVLSSTDIPRSEIYVISKAWPSQYRDLREACLGSLERLQTDYIDLYLLHWPLFPLSYIVAQSITQDATLLFPIFTAIFCTFSITAATLQYWFIEKPFLKEKDKITE